MRTLLWRMLAISVFCALSGVASAANNTNVTFSPWNDPNAVQVVEDPERGTVMRMISQGPLSPPEAFSAAAASWVPDHFTTWGEITNLTFDYKGEKGKISGGTPRFYVGLDLNGNGQYDSYYDEATDTWVQDDGHIFIMAGSGTPPWQEDWPSGWTSTGNVIARSERLYETSQVGAGDSGTWGVTYADTLNTVWPDTGQLLKDVQVLRIGVVLDGGWVDGPDGYWQQMLVDGITFEGTLPITAGGAAFSEFLTVSVPEPSALTLLSIGAIAILFKVRRLRSSR